MNLNIISMKLVTLVCHGLNSGGTCSQIRWIQSAYVALKPRSAAPNIPCTLLTFCFTVVGSEDAVAGSSFKLCNNPPLWLLQETIIVYDMKSEFVYFGSFIVLNSNSYLDPKWRCWWKNMSSILDPSRFVSLDAFLNLPEPVSVWMTAPNLPLPKRWGDP